MKIIVFLFKLLLLLLVFKKSALQINYSTFLSTYTVGHIMSGFGCNGAVMLIMNSKIAFMQIFYLDLKKKKIKLCAWVMFIYLRGIINFAIWLPGKYCNICQSIAGKISQLVA